jgi:uncharacterized repeat protein (TIGR03847 family)
MGTVHNLGQLAHISAEAIGQPGQRRFRLLAANRTGDAARLWLEKEQLSALGEAIETVLRDEGYRYERLPLDDAEPDPPFPLSASIEMRLARLSLGLNRETTLLVVYASDSADEDDDDATLVSVEIDYRRAWELRRQVTEVVAAGRPPCPLCTAPMDPEGHVCVRTNGHHPH